MAEFSNRSLFMASTPDPDLSRIMLCGLPFDGTVSFRPGSRFGPEAIRSVSEGIEEYSIYQNKDLRDLSFHDLGDLRFSLGNTEKSLEEIYQVAADLFSRNKLPCFLGGEHLVTWPVVKAAAERFPGLTMMHFDAHADLRDGYLGEQYSHASVMRLCAELLGKGAVYQFGIRSGDKPEFDYARRNTRMHLYEVVEPVKEVLPELKNKSVYVTIDIDVLDPAYAPGTGTPEAGGCTPRDLLEVIPMLGNLNIVGCDLVEVSPHYDHSNCTAVLAAKLVRELLLAVG
ncbi:MAG: agmatinase [Bacillota bacterium]